MKMRSRVSESEALCSSAGLGASICIRYET